MVSNALIISKSRRLTHTQSVQDFGVFGLDEDAKPTSHATVMCFVASACDSVDRHSLWRVMEEQMWRTSLTDTTDVSFFSNFLPFLKVNCGIPKVLAYRNLTLLNEYFESQLLLQIL